MNTDDKIRAILRMEADTVDPSPAGWDAIQAGIAARRSRAWWMRGTALAGAAAVVVGVLGYVAVDRSRQAVTSPPTTQGPSVSPTPLPSITPVPAGPDEPIGAIWPLTTTHEVSLWNADHSTYPALATATGSALAFARNYIGANDARVFPLQGSFGENKFEVRREDVAISVVTVKGFGPDGTSPFVVIRAEADAVRIASPAPGGSVSGRFTARGPFEAVDPAIDVVLHADSDRSAPVQLAKVRATTGPDGWSAALSFTTTAKTGSLLVTNASLRDGGVGSASAIPLVFGTVQAAAGPERMVAVRDGRIALLSTSTGELIRWLTDAEPGGGASDPELSEDGKTVVYSQGAGTCASEIRSVPVSGGAPTTLVGADRDAVFRPTRRGAALAYVRQICDTRRQEVVIQAATRLVEPVAGNVLGGPVAGERFVAFVSYDGATTLHTIDTLGELADNPVDAPKGCAWGAPAWGPNAADGREQLFVVAMCTPRAGAHETWLYRFDADARDMTRLTRLDVPSVVTIDFAGDALVIGADDPQGPDRHFAYTFAGGVLRRVPGEAEHPTWDS